MGKRGTEHTGKINVDQLAESLGLTAWDDLREMNVDYVASAGDGIEDEDERSEAEYRLEGELYNSWHDAVTSAAESLYGEHGLELAPIKFRRKVPEGTRPYEFRIVPKISWPDAADKIRNTIEGDGILGYYIDGLKGFLRSGPYTARSAVLAHLHWIKKYPAVYGTASADTLYQRHWRD